MTSTATERSTPPALTRDQRVPTRRTRVFALTEARWAAAALGLFLAGLAAQLGGAPTWLFWALYLACYVTGGWEPAWAGLQALRDKTLDVDLLMIVAAIGAAAIGQITDGALLIVIFATSGALEALATARTADSVRGLLDLAPQRATRLGPDGIAVTVEAAELVIGDVVLVRPGERIGADGTVVDGTSEVDQATITGEPLPVDKAAGDGVFAGTSNGTGSLRIRVDRPAADSVVARIAAQVEQASDTKAPTQLFIEKVEQRYSVGVVVATLVLFAVPLAFGDSLTDALLRAMTFMIVASPCAIVLSTMPPLLSAVANAGRHGVLVKSAVIIEQLAATSTVALDKTGTLTEGTPSVAAVHAVPGAGVETDELLALAAAAEHDSEHPLARAVVAAARADGAHAILPATGFVATPGRGVTARVAGYDVEIGNPAHLLDTANPTAAGAQRVVTETEEAGRAAVLVCLDQQPVGVLAIADRIRADAASTVAALTELTGRSPVLLTGDNPHAAARVADAVGITDVRAGLLPQDKAEAITELEAGGHRTVFVGDGINDAPALAAAHTGLAMGRAGSDLALDTADVITVRDELATIPALITLANRARRLVVENLVIAGVMITGLVIWDLVGHLPLPLGVAGHEGSTILVALNGLRLLRETAWTPHANPH